MIIKLGTFSLLVLAGSAWSATPIHLHDAPLNKVHQFAAKTLPSATTKTDGLRLVSQTKFNSEQIIRYQQTFKGIPIVGAQITVSSKPKAVRGAKVNGLLFDEIQINTNPAFTSMQAIDLAKKSYASHAPQIHQAESALQIRTDKNEQLKLVYLVSLRGTTYNNKPLASAFIIDAQTGDIVTHWNTIPTYSDSGPGGNEKVHEYWYGKDGLPALEVSQNGPTCTLDDGQVSVVNLKFTKDWNENQSPIQYNCGNNVEDLVHGAYSASNDAYYFGHTIISLYKDWYGVNALEDENGNAKKLIMGVHYGKDVDNAFWDPNSQVMSFGDGRALYPLVSLDIATHEVSHGFTQHHSDLEYHDESGALNESFSDMSAQASRAYLLETIPQLFNAINLIPNKITWGIGDTVTPELFYLKALRFMDQPSLDGHSSDCVNKSLARKNQSICAITADDVFAEAKILSPHDEEEQQSYIVHLASGVFNRAFYLMSKDLGIKTSFQIMVNANIKYWNPTTNFSEGACGVLYAAKDLNVNSDVVITSFKKVGIDTTHCNSTI